MQPLYSSQQVGGWVGGWAGTTVCSRCTPQQVGGWGRGSAHKLCALCFACVFKLDISVCVMLGRPRKPALSKCFGFLASPPPPGGNGADLLRPASRLEGARPLPGGLCRCALRAGRAGVACSLPLPHFKRSCWQPIAPPPSFLPLASQTRPPPPPSGPARAVARGP